MVKTVHLPAAHNDNGHAMIPPTVAAPWKEGDLCVFIRQGKSYYGHVLDVTRIADEQTDGARRITYRVLVNSRFGAFHFNADDLVRPSDLAKGEKPHESQTDQR